MSPALEVPPETPKGDIKFLSVAGYLTYGAVWGTDFNGQRFLVAPGDSDNELMLIPELSSSTGLSFEGCFGGMRPGHWRLQHRRFLWYRPGRVFLLAQNVGFDMRLGYRAYAFDRVNGHQLEDDLGAGAYELRLGPALYF